MRRLYDMVGYDPLVQMLSALGETKARGVHYPSCHFWFLAGQQSRFMNRLGQRASRPLEWKPTGTTGVPPVGREGHWDNGHLARWREGHWDNGHLARWRGKPLGQRASRPLERKAAGTTGVSPVAKKRPLHSSSAGAEDAGMKGWRGCAAGRSLLSPAGLYPAETRKDPLYMAFAA